MPTIRIPAPLRVATDGAAEVVVDAPDVHGALVSLQVRHPQVGDRLWDSQGRLHRFVNVFVGEEDVRDLQGLGTRLAHDDVVAIVPAVAGGSLPSR